MKFKNNSLSGILRSLIADEFLAWTSYYFYELISQGKALNFTNKIFNKNGKDELEDHYHKLVTWTQSKEIPIPTGLNEMQDICNTQYVAYNDQTDTSTLVDIMINAEKEAIDAYVQAMKEPEVLTCPDLLIMLGEICNDEREHLKELMDVKSNLTKYDNKTVIDEDESKMVRDDVYYSNFTERIRRSFSSDSGWYVDYRDEDGESTDYFDSEKEAQEFIDHCTDRASKHAAEGEKFYLVKGPYQK